MVYNVYLQVMRDGRTHAHVPDLVGCNWRAATPEEAMARAPAAIAGHLAWLRRHGQPVPGPQEPVEAVLAARERSTARNGGLVGFFPEDQQPVSEGERERFLHLMACSRADLLALTRGLDEEVLRRRPAPVSWSIYEILRHVASAEQWYLTRLFGTRQLPRLRRAESVWERLELTRALAVERLGGLGEEARSARVRQDEDGELWTARKVFRRYVEHEREHYAHVCEVLDALGVARP